MLQKLVIACIKIYRATVSNLCWASCRFYPTCSQYALEAIQSFGVLQGTILICKRLGRCHPLCDGGYDPIPMQTTKQNTFHNCKLKHDD